MVVGAFPAAKLASLLLKQVSKPIANVLKHRAKSSPFFRTYICMPPAQFYNWCEVQTKMWILNLGKPVNIPVLNEAMAIELGANLLGEGIIFLIAAAALIAEYNRSSNKEAAKEAAKAEEMAKLNATLMELYITTEQQATEIRELRRVVYDLDSRVVQIPWLPKKEPKLPDPDPPKKQKPPPSSGITISLPNSEIYSGNSSLLTKGGPSNSIDNVSHEKHRKINTVNNSLLSNALVLLENEVFRMDKQERSEGLLTKALNQFYKDIYGVQLRL